MPIDSPEVDSPEEGSDRELPPLSTRDPFLQYLVGITNDSEKGWIPVTLGINGMFVSGTLATAKEYFTSMAETITTGALGREESDLKTKFADVILGFIPPADEAFPFTGYNYVHIRDAKFFAASGQPIQITSPLIWRGRIGEVAGWSYGRMAASSDSR